MSRDGSVLDTYPTRRRFDEAIDRMRGHAFAQYGAVLSYSTEQDPINNPRNS